MPPSGDFSLDQTEMPSARGYPVADASNVLREAVSAPILFFEACFTFFPPCFSALPFVFCVDLDTDITDVGASGAGIVLRRVKDLGWNKKNLALIIYQVFSMLTVIICVFTKTEFTRR